ncbi:MAG: hypothetical protein HY579_02125 [Nitrospinae bacterium]|nr:hypothetical protein [Nitrospinota bacterium]
MRGVIIRWVALSSLLLLPGAAFDLVFSESALARSASAAPESEPSPGPKDKTGNNPAQDLQKKLKEFESFSLDGLQNKIGELEKLPGELAKWAEEVKNEEVRYLDKILDVKIFQTNVFFGSAAALFAVLAVLFVGKFAFNILRDGLSAVQEKVWAMMGRDSTRVPDRHFAPIMNGTRGGPGKSAPAAGTASAAKPVSKKKFLFGEVLTEFVNPAVKRDVIRQALDLQAQRDPKPKVGAILTELNAVKNEEVEKTLSLQKKFRSKN